MSADDLSDGEPENEDLDDQVENGDTGDQKSSDDSIVWNLGQVRKGWEQWIQGEECQKLT